MADEDEVSDSSGGGLNQEEVEELVAREEPRARSAIIRADGRRAGEEEKVKVEPFDFRNPVFLTEVEMRQLRALHEDFARSLEARLSLLLRIDFSLTAPELVLQSYQEFVGGMKNPTHVSLFKVEPLPGVGLLEFSPQLALSVASRMLGGDGGAVRAERHLTEIEADLADDAFAILLEEWSSRWKHEPALEPTIIGHEVSGRFLQTSQRDEMMLVVRLKGGMRDFSDIIQIGFPVFMVEPLVKQLKQARKRALERAGPDKKSEWRAAYEGIRVNITAQWNACELTVEELLEMKPGDVIPLSRELLGNTHLCLAGTPAFRCEAGVEDGRVAVRIEEKLEREFIYVFGGKQ